MVFKILTCIALACLVLDLGLRYLFHSEDSTPIKRLDEKNGSWQEFLRILLVTVGMIELTFFNLFYGILLIRNIRRVSRIKRTVRDKIIWQVVIIQLTIIVYASQLWFTYYIA